MIQKGYVFATEYKQRTADSSFCLVPRLHHVVDGHVEQAEAAEEFGEFVLAELLFAGDADLVAGAWGDEDADAASLVDDVVALEDVEGAQDGVGVDLVLGSQFADAGHALVFLILAGEDVVAHAVGYLHVDGSLVLVDHRVKILWVTICARQKER